MLMKVKASCDGKCEIHQAKSPTLTYLGITFSNGGTQVLLTMCGMNAKAVQTFADLFLCLGNGVEL